ncbi:transcriptional regulator [Pseudomonas graminis]|uniref:histone-like nucleoid-structuring protein, MvaT/MvaU family n=1 Tax=Pseudomonas graminis TaxID=158627 RepID=UPI00234B30C5|nr:histone-like nucleoid-structuring protein, MvaT/MvaU family [Pseudomonas graminis]MDC6378933.1 transcriptional regulator [Pseudomonas graminis]
MSRLMEFRKLEEQLAIQLAELETLKNDSALKKEFEFETKLRILLGEYRFTLREIIDILDPHTVRMRNAPPVPVEKKTRKPRKLKVYKHPDTGNVVQTKGGNHKLLQIWKSEFGSEVETWLVK